MTTQQPCHRVLRLHFAFFSLSASFLSSLPPFLSSLPFLFSYVPFLPSYLTSIFQPLLFFSFSLPTAFQKSHLQLEL